jgi:hypothetical protein
MEVLSRDSVEGSGAVLEGSFDRDVVAKLKTLEGRLTTTISKLEGPPDNIDEVGPRAPVAAEIVGSLYLLALLRLALLEPY